ncbi:hypothetical protein [Sphingobium sp. YR768]|uniref:hypothetical protein n=1 Tax=Sphingobium sp. YR768 TaxID=1884365 RepID=UPI000B82760F|nr:hypothetical protein [Sphingobium sp. YR768]
MLVPGVDASLYPAFFVDYGLAIIFALISHLPGGLGIFEAVIVATLPSRRWRWRTARMTS